MTEYVDNVLRITGSKIQIEAFLKVISVTHPSTVKFYPRDYWILENLYPLPPELSNLDPRLSTANMSDDSLELVAKYGSNNSEEWQVDNWGVKWPDLDTTMKYQSEKKLVLDFMTPGDPPGQAIAKIAKDWPELSFYLKYEYQYFGPRGIYSWVKGNLVYKSWSNPTSDV